MQITIGRGRNRQSVEIPHVALQDRETRERIGWNLKQMLFDRGVIKNLG